MSKHNILLPTDFSDNAWSAAVYALKLYAEQECTFYFLHSSVLKVSTMSSMSNKLTDAMIANATKDLADLKQMAESANPNANHDFKTILSVYDLDDAIKATVKEYKIDLVVMGTKGATGADEILFGSNTVTVIGKIKTCPILAIPEEFDFVKPKQIAFPTDYNRFYGEELDKLKELADLYNSKIRIVHVNKNEVLTEKQNYNLSMLKVSLEDYNHTFHWMPDYESKEQVIKDFVSELDIDILVMIHYQHSFIESIVKEPVIKHLGFHVTIPFLIIPETKGLV
jgi:nucleotide-binding universal stress UspA family protein